MSARAFADEVTAVAKGLVARGVEPGDRVAIMSRTRYEWTVVDFAVWAAGAVGVPVYETSSAEQVQLDPVRLGRAGRRRRDARARRARRRGARRPAAPHRRLDPRRRRPRGTRVGGSRCRRRRGRPPHGAGGRVRPGDDHLHVGHDRTAQGRRADARQLRRTSRSTARSRSHDVCATPGSRTLLFMPLAHVFARFIQVLCIPSGATMGYTPDPKQLLPDLASVPADVHPRRPPGVREGLQLGRAEGRRVAGAPAALPVGRTGVHRVLARARDQRRPLPRAARPARTSPTASCTASCAPRSAASARWAISGGAPLGERLGHFYRGLGLHVLEGYGLTETTAPTAVSRPDALKIGSVGPPFPGTSLRIDDDGEIFVKGPHVFRGVPRQPRGDRGGARRRLVPHRRPRRDGRRRLPADHRPVEGDHRDRRRQERRPGRAGGPPARAPAGEPVRRRRRRAAVHRRAGDARRRHAARLAVLARPARDGRRRPPRRIPTWSPRSTGRAERANEAVSRAESIRKVPVLADRLHRGERLPHARRSR